MTELKRCAHRLAGASLIAALMAGCGGGGGSAAGDSGASAPGSSSAFAQQCAPTNAYSVDATGNLRAGYQPGTLDAEKNFARDYVNEAYLWYREMPAVNAADALYSDVSSASATYRSLDNYFQALKTRSSTPSGKRTDEFSFIYPTELWRQLSSGSTTGYGIEWALLSNTVFRVAFVEPNSPAAQAGVARGDTLVSANGINAAQGYNAVRAALFPAAATTTSFVFQPVAGASKSVSLTSGAIAQSPVLGTQVFTVPGAGGTTKKVGYLNFTTFLAQNGEGQLISAINSFATQAINDLVLDLRYNGGGYIYISAQLGYMIAGNARTSGKTYERFQYNDKRAADSNNPNNNTPFFNVTSGFAGSGTAANQPLPSLNLPRVFVLTKSDTCSASESLINALRGVDVEVIQIGGTTCGKPYGFTAKDNCGVSYFPIEFKGVNNKGFGDFADGFIPGGSGATGVPGCAVADDFNKPLGDPTEGMLAAALNYQRTGACPALALGQRKSGGPLEDGILLRDPVFTGKYR